MAVRRETILLWRTRIGEALFFLVLFLTPLIGGLGVLGWQTLQWLSEGEWPPMSLLNFLVWVDLVNAEWARRPTSWVGIWRILNFLPLSVSAIGYAMLMAPAAREIMEAKRPTPQNAE